jgi:acyl-coenzyme A thioesterase PaaI-like protein
MSIPFGVHIPFVASLGFTLEKFESGTSELHYSPSPQHLNSFDITHGGAVMTLLDVVMSNNGEHLVAKGLLLHRTKTMAFTDGKVYDATGQLCAHATGTFKYVKRTPSVTSPISTD